MGKSEGNFVELLHLPSHEFNLVIKAKKSQAQKIYQCGRKMTLKVELFQSIKPLGIKPLKTKTRGSIFQAQLYITQTYNTL